MLAASLQDAGSGVLVRLKPDTTGTTKVRLKPDTTGTTKVWLKPDTTEADTGSVRLEPDRDPWAALERNCAVVRMYLSQGDDLPTARELYHAALGYKRPVGNRDPDTDPMSAVTLAPLVVH